jgi:ABC-type transport system involved in multi-copper enzyme maturation permease subunit
MLLNIIFREIRHSVLSLRLHISLILTLVIFGFGTAAFVKNYPAEREDYTRWQGEFIEKNRRMAESNLTRLAVNRQNLILEPRANTFITDAREKYLPSRFEFSGYNVFSFSVRPGSVNPYLSAFEELNWMFIIAIIISFTVFLFTFDTISGEKENKTLSQSLANSVPRGTLLFGKYLSVILTTLLVLVPGFALSLIILLVTGTVVITTQTIFEIAGFLFIVALFVACIAAFGLLSSVVSRSSNVSLLAALTLWLIFVVVVPNTAVFWAQSLFPIESVENVRSRLLQTLTDLEKNAPKGSWSSSYGNPFLPQHELRANHQTNRMNARVNITKAYFNEMFRQFERTRMLTMLSPVSVFEYLCEAVVGGGYVRFQKIWRDLYAWQAQFLAFFKEKDAQDEKSPHWYNPYEDYSTTRKGVSYEEVPVFEAKMPSFQDRVSSAGLYLLVMALYAAGAFALSFVLFIRYDVR